MGRLEDTLPLKDEDSLHAALAAVLTEAHRNGVDVEGARDITIEDGDRLDLEVQTWRIE